MTIANETANVAVKTPWGSVTERREIHSLEMQGTVGAPHKCSVQTGTVGEMVLAEDLGYKYRGCISIPPLSCVDDLLTVSNCSLKSTKMNAFIQDKINTRHLKFGETKCFRMHIGPNKTNCSKNKIHQKDIIEEEEIKYLGSILTPSGKFNEDIECRYKKGISSANTVIQ